MWAICYENPSSGWLSNHWITLHEIGNIAGFKPVLVMDVWEHAFLLDYKPAERAKYIDKARAQTRHRGVLLKCCLGRGGAADGVADCGEALTGY
jgi:Iron/manganese superoxide dismutases, C-terminal domain